MPSFGIIIEALIETNQTILFVHNTVLTHVVRENSMCIYLVIFNAAHPWTNDRGNGDKPVHAESNMVNFEIPVGLNRAREQMRSGRLN